MQSRFARMTLFAADVFGSTPNFMLCMESAILCLKILFEMSLKIMEALIHKLLNSGFQT